MPVARRVVQHIALTFIEVVQGHRVLVGLEAFLGSEVVGVASDVGDADFVDNAVEKGMRFVRVPTNSTDWPDYQNA